MTNPNQPPEAADDAPDRRPAAPRPAFTLGSASSLAILAAVVLLLWLPFHRGGTSGDVRGAICQSNLRRVAAALEQYSQKYGSLPPACTFDPAGRPLHSWRTLILPFLDPELYDRIDLSKPWDDPVNQAAARTVDQSIPWAYRCPSARAPQTKAQTPYLAVVAQGSCLRVGEPRKLSEVTDDHELTLLLVEVDMGQSVHWMSPVDASEAVISSLGKGEALPHAAGIRGVNVRGQVIHYPAHLPAAKLRALITIDAGDDALARD